MVRQAKKGAALWSGGGCPDRPQAARFPGETTKLSLLAIVHFHAAIALIGLSLYLTHGSESEKKTEPALQDNNQESF